MLPSYDDIRALSTAGPLWYDDRGVPRYVEFHPTHLGIYDHYALLAEIACQDCGQRFRVGEGWREFYYCHHGTRVIMNRVPKPTVESVQRFHYGDPPRHHDRSGEGCVGEVMNCDDIRVLEFWRRDCTCKPGQPHHDKDCGVFDWRRDATLEIQLDA